MTIERNNYSSLVQLQRFITLDLANANEILQHLHAFDPASDAPGQNPVNNMPVYGQKSMQVNV
jgi:hypothetical protein